MDEACAAAHQLLVNDPLEQAVKGKRKHAAEWQGVTSPGPAKRVSAGPSHGSSLHGVFVRHPKPIVRVGDAHTAGSEAPSAPAHPDYLQPVPSQQTMSSVQDQLSSISHMLRSYIDNPDSKTADHHIKLVALQRKYDDLLLTNGTLRANMACLRTSMDRVKTAHGRLAAELTRMVDEKELDRRPDERSRTSIGIDPWIIQDLAADLSTGRDSAEVASELFTLADSAMSYPTGPEDIKRESLAPRERLRNLEGIMDVSLGRMEALEKRYKQLRGNGLHDVASPVDGQVV